MSQQKGQDVRLDVRLVPALGFLLFSLSPAFTAHLSLPPRLHFCFLASAARVRPEETVSRLGGAQLETQRGPAGVGEST